MVDLTPSYSLAEIRHGTGFTKAARFVQESDFERVKANEAALLAALVELRAFVRDLATVASEVQDDNDKGGTDQLYAGGWAEKANKMQDLAQAAIAQARGGSLGVQPQAMLRSQRIPDAIVDPEPCKAEDLEAAVEPQVLAAADAAGVRLGSDRDPRLLPRPGAICRNCNADAVAAVGDWLYCVEHLSGALGL